MAGTAAAIFIGIWIVNTRKTNLAIAPQDLNISLKNQDTSPENEVDETGVYKGVDVAAIELAQSKLISRINEYSWSDYLPQITNKYEIFYNNDTKGVEINITDEGKNEPINNLRDEALRWLKDKGAPTDFMPIKTTFSD